ncbi:hypothetical protein FRB96_007867 [Tulasnella sp. 330]|nr:hypothetical protein FRB96_007867 [Tulasnella sp. 330]KAG8874176.1 hypothetical protein FRB97_006104 [Tulasnella sp. 331]KAG8885201.1 hypothetical protein FRB98_001929 [Tulasnella sp. 332]
MLPATNVVSSIPPVITDGYKEKGEYKEYAGLRTYFTGPTNTGRTILVFYDIFSFFPQTMQGADIIASSTKSLVLMPDFFRGETLDISVYPPKNDDDRKKVAAFLSTWPNPNDRMADVVTVVEALKKDGRTKLGVMGFCWGGKIAILSGATGSFEACAAIHPAMASAEAAKDMTSLVAPFIVSADYANDLKVPVALFISKDESEEEAEKFVGALSSKPFASKNVYKRYGSMRHGFAAARANFQDPEALREYEDVFVRLSQFFNGVL